MMGGGFVDLDELVLLCRDDSAKTYIAEAVGAYRAGAYRACIVTTWIAVVYDFLGKLRELALAGDAQAQKMLEEFEQHRINHNVQGSLEFERTVVARAREPFQIISPVEAVDLERLLEDRNRCAHPSMNSSDETYSPSAELARSHLRSAVMHVLRHPPVQGKAALDRLISDVQSEYFPTTEGAAQAHFSRGPLTRPRESLVRNFIIVLLKTTLLATPPEAAFIRHMAALKAVRKMHPEASNRALTQEVARIARLVPDVTLGSLVALLSYVEDSWHFLEEDMQGKLKRFTEQLATDQLTRYLPFALTYTPLREEARRRLAATTTAELTALVRSAAQIELVDHAIERYVAASNFDTANTLGRGVIVPLVQYFTADNVRTIVDAAGQNSQINGSTALESVLRALKSSEQTTPEIFSRLLTKAGLGKRFPWLLEDQ